MGARLHTRIATFFLLGIAVSAAAQVIGVNQGGTGATTQAGAFANLVGPGGTITGTLNSTYTGTNSFTGTIKAGAVSLAGGVVGCPTSSTIAQCVALLPSGGGTILLQNGSYTSGYPGAIPYGVPADYINGCMATDNVTIIGSATPIINSGYTALIGGTIILGPFADCSNNVAFMNLGFDTGSAWVAAGNTANDGLDINGVLGPQAGENNLSGALNYGATLINVVSLNSSPTALYHAVLVEHHIGVFMMNVTAMYGTHCIAIKSENVIAYGLNATSCSTEGVIIKDDTYTPTVQNIQIDGMHIATLTAGDTPIGLNLDAEAAGTVQNLQISHEYTNGTAYGVYAQNNSTYNSGIGGINNVKITGSTWFQTDIANPSAWAVCFQTATNTGLTTQTLEYITLDHDSCLNSTNGEAQGYGQIGMNIAMNHSSISNWYSDNSQRSGLLQGVFSIDGWREDGPMTTIPTFSSTYSGTVVDLHAWSSSRQNTPASTSGGAVINVAPYWNGTNMVSPNAYPITGDTDALKINGNSNGNELIVQPPGGAYNAFLLNDSSGMYWNQPSGKNALGQVQVNGYASYGFGINNSGSTNAYGAPNDSSYSGNAQGIPHVFMTNGVVRAEIGPTGGVSIGSPAWVNDPGPGNLNVQNAIQVGGGALIPSSSKILQNCGTATFSASVTSAALPCSWVTASSTCNATWIGTGVGGGALAAAPGAGTVTLTAATSNSDTAAVACSAN